MTTGSDRRRWLPGDAVLSGVVDSATRKLAEQTEEAFRTRTAATGIAKWNVLDQQRAGHLFELWHKHSFNIGGEVDAAEFAARSGESTFQAGLAWAGGAIGQTVIPGALVGGFVGQVAATLIVQGLQYALSAAIDEGVDEERIALLEAETRAAIDAAAVLGEAERVLGEAYDVCIAQTAVPAVDDLLLTTLRDGPDQGLLALTDLGRRVDGVPLFLTAEEFDDWMTDPLTALTLDPNR